MTIDYDKITNEIIQGMTDSSAESSGIIKHILKTAIGDTILGRFVLYKPNPKNSIYHYLHHGWMTNSGQYVSYLCPSTNKENCPICRKSIAFYKSNNPFLVEASKKIRRKENWLVNMYIIDDTKHPENNGKIKVFRYGKQVKDILEEATTGVDAEIFGKNIWRLDSKGCNFRITVKPNSEKKDAWPSYTASKFLPPSDLGVGEEDLKRILDETFDLTTIFDKTYTYDELGMELQKYFIDDLQKQEEDFDEKTLGTVKPTLAKAPAKDDDDLDMSPPKASAPTKPASPPAQPAEPQNSSDEIDRMLEELG